MLGLCSGDPIVDTLRSVFHANIVEVPEERIKPLIVAAEADGRHTSFRGMLSVLLKQPSSYVDPTVLQSLMANISGQKSREVHVDIGLKILGNFLAAFGIPSINISAAFSGAQKVSFSFDNVIRYYVDDGSLGNELIGNAINFGNPAAAIFSVPDNLYRCYILDSTITSSDFTISVEQSSGNDFKINLPAIQQIVKQADVDVAVESSSSTSVTFTGQKHLCFAFSCLLAELDANGRVISLPPGGELSPIRDMLARGASAVARPAHVLFTKTPAMIETEFFTEGNESKAAGR